MHIGLIGGIGVAATLGYYQRLTAEGKLGFLDLGQEPLRAVVVGRARLGERELARRAMQQAGAKRGFQLFMKLGTKIILATLIAMAAAVARDRRSQRPAPTVPTGA